MDPQAQLDAEHREATEQLAALKRDFAEMVAASADSNADDEHDPEGSTIAFERSQVGALIEQAERRLGEIEAARVRVDTGTYGVCELCDELIAPGRLEARPIARTCVACAGTSRTSG
ncbi:TraR/DksA C4-type zinc finger protein [Aeromicrobium panaciterrae]|uniref:TraR/DksA family transcriptional regulator n=1 Tax=Aeromicrobium panaciterrae TaxID=363861 RepID=UPI0031D10FF8